MIVTSGASLQVDPQWLQPRNHSASPEAAGLKEVERHAILQALERCRGKIYGPDGAAAALGLKPTTLYGKMRKHQIARPPALK
jgi:formate hydrogenlyase transcriptional activator